MYQVGIGKSGSDVKASTKFGMVHDPDGAPGPQPSRQQLKARSTVSTVRGRTSRALIIRAHPSSWATMELKVSVARRTSSLRGNGMFCTQEYRSWIFFQISVVYGFTPLIG